ncbi:hypothetical protein OROGR_033036 [Orobanche gracilis]
MSIRSGNYSHDEDKLLCNVYMNISQDPATGRYQSAEEFWSRVVEGYNASKATSWETRTARSLQARIQIIEKNVRKFHGCIRTVEGTHQSGISHEDVMNKARKLFAEDPNYKKRWRFHHVWSTIGEFEKFRGAAKDSKKKARTHNSSASKNQTPDSHDSEGMPSFSMNLGDDDDGSFNNDDNNEIGGSSSSRPIGVKKAKNRAHKDETTKSLLEKMRFENQQYMEQMKTSNEQLNQQMERKNALKETKEENKILFRDSSLIQDPRHRAFIQAEQARILQKRAQQSRQPGPFATASYFPYFNNLGGSGSDIPEY